MRSNNLTIYQFNNVEKYLGLLMLLGAILFNLWIYRLEPTAKVDPNDNTFQFALVDRTNQIWDFANKTCSSKKYLAFSICHLAFLADHWVPNWAQGYNLPYYYSHIPQILIVASWRFLNWLIGSIGQIGSISLFQYYHFIIYLLLSLFPLSIFVSLRILSLSWITAGLGAAVASHLSTDGLYGLDPASFLWRGWGLSSQLFAMIWLPLALAYAYRLLQSQQSLASQRPLHRGFEKRNNEVTKLRNYVPAVVTLAATTAGHLGIGIIAFLSIAILWISPFVSRLFSAPKAIVKLLNCYIVNKNSSLKQQFNNLAIYQCRNLIMLFGGAFLLLGYWIIPILINGAYHNISVWDPIWKFDSYGAGEVLKNLLNGDLFDFGRFPILTVLMFIGLFAALRPSNNLTIYQFNNYSGFSLLFIFWILLYFGRTTWGGLIDLLPGMKEFHTSRFLVGVHLAGLFLIPMGIEWIASRITHHASQFVNHSFISLFVYSFISLFVYFSVYPQTLRYASYDDFLINRANENYKNVEADVSLLLSTLRNYQATKPARVFAGRGGNWGRDFRVAETPYYIFLSTYGFPTILWLPETWSPNSDIEQYFSENNPAHYNLYNVRYVVTPIHLNGEPVEPQPFWKPLASGKTWKLYSVSAVIPDLIGDPAYNTLDSHVRGNDTSFGYITTGIRPAVVGSGKEDFRNVVRLWLHSDYPKQGLYPQLVLSDKLAQSSLPHFLMKDEVTYQIPDGSLHNLFAEPPIYQNPTNPTNPTNESQATIQQFNNITILSQSSDSDMVFKAKFEVKESCPECVVVLRQTFHPSWQATVDGKKAEVINVFPFYNAVVINQPGQSPELVEGTHEVIFSYQPSTLKISLLAISLVLLIPLIAIIFSQSRRFVHS